MAAKGYATTTTVAAYLGATFTAGQITEAGLLIQAAEEWIDARMGQAWLVASPTTEIHTVPADGMLRLYNRPVTAITSVAVRAPTIGATSTALVAGTSYELLDAATGLLAVSLYQGYRASVVYTHTLAVPERIALATKLLVAYWMEPILSGEQRDIKGIQFGQDLKIDYATVAQERGVPPRVLELLNVGRRLVFA